MFRNTYTLLIDCRCLSVYLLSPHKPGISGASGSGSGSSATAGPTSSLLELIDVVLPRALQSHFSSLERGRRWEREDARRGVKMAKRSGGDMGTITKIPGANVDETSSSSALLSLLQERTDELDEHTRHRTNDRRAAAAGAGTGGSVSTGVIHTANGVTDVGLAHMEGVEARGSGGSHRGAGGKLALGCHKRVVEADCELSDMCEWFNTNSNSCEECPKDRPHFQCIYKDDSVARDYGIIPERRASTRGQLGGGHGAFARGSVNKFSNGVSSTSSAVSSSPHVIYTPTADEAMRVQFLPLDDIPRSMNEDAQDALATRAMARAHDLRLLARWRQTPEDAQSAAVAERAAMVLDAVAKLGSLKPLHGHGGQEAVQKGKEAYGPIFVIDVAQVAAARHGMMSARLALAQQANREALYNLHRDTLALKERGWCATPPLYRGRAAVLRTNCSLTDRLARIPSTTRAMLHSKKLAQPLLDLGVLPGSSPKAIRPNAGLTAAYRGPTIPCIPLYVMAPQPIRAPVPPPVVAPEPAKPLIMGRVRNGSSVVRVQRPKKVGGAVYVRLFPNRSLDMCPRNAPVFGGVPAHEGCTRPTSCCRKWGRSGDLQGMPAAVARASCGTLIDTGCLLDCNRIRELFGALGKIVSCETRLTSYVRATVTKALTANETDGVEPTYNVIYPGEEGASPKRSEKMPRTMFRTVADGRAFQVPWSSVMDASGPRYRFPLRCQVRELLSQG